MDTPNPELLNKVQVLAHQLLEWVGFGTLAGLLAKAIMPGKDPGGAVATLAMGVGGTIIGCGILSFFSPSTYVTPISGMGFCVATAGAFIILFLYKLLGGYYFVEGEGPIRRRGLRRIRGTRPSTVVIEE